MAQTGMVESWKQLPSEIFLRLLYLQGESKCIMTYIRFDDKRYNKNLFWSLERSKRKINISFQITFSFFVICRVQISDYTIYHHRKNIEFHFSFCFKLRIQKTNGTCTLNPINYIKNNPNEHAHGAFCLNSKNVWYIYFTLHIDKIQENRDQRSRIPKFYFLFLSGFSFTTIHESQDYKGRTWAFL